MRIVACLIAVTVLAAPAAARTHKSSRSTKPSAAPAGATAVPAGGLKLYCAGKTSPLLVRKFTQGSGTTVTVLCR